MSLDEKIGRDHYHGCVYDPSLVLSSLGYSLTWPYGAAVHMKL